jgi:hypothetical protein
VNLHIHSLTSLHGVISAAEQKITTTTTADAAAAATTTTRRRLFNSTYFSSKLKSNAHQKFFSNPTKLS